MEEGYPCSVLERKIEGKEVTILGVTHTKESFEKYRNFFKKLVSSSDALVLEQIAATSVHNFQHEPTFFGPFAELARSQGKKVYSADPTIRSGIKYNQQMGAKAMFANILGLWVGLTGVRLGSKALIAVGVSAELLSFSLLFGSDKFDAFRYLHLDKDMEWIDALAFGYHDYRNLKIAKGIRRICQQKDEKRLLAVHGDGHSRGIDFYLAHPSLANAKSLVYWNYERIARNCEFSDVREYIPRTDKEAHAQFEKDIEQCLDIDEFLSPKDYHWERIDFEKKK